MKKLFLRIFLTAALAILYASCEDEGVSSLMDQESPIKWEILPDDELSKVTQWYENRAQGLGIGKQSEIMWGTARYSKAVKDGYIITVFVAENNSKVFKTAYIFKRKDGYSAYILGHSALQKGQTIDGNFSGELRLYDLEGNMKTSSVLENGKTIKAKSANGISPLSNLRTAYEDDPIILGEVVITGTRIETNTTWLLMSSLPYYDLSFFFPGYRYEGYSNGTHHYATPLANTPRPFDYAGGPPLNWPCVANAFHDNKPASSYSVTIYVDQPKPGTREKWVWVDTGSGEKLSAGHTFVRMTKYNSDGTKVEYIAGFYPMNNSVSPVFGDITDTGGYRNDNLSDYDVSITYNNVHSIEFFEAIDYLSGLQHATYNLNTQNCADIGIGVAAALERVLPDTQGTWSGGGGTNPADLGQDIRAMPNSSSYTINRAGGTATTNHPSGC